MLKIIKSILMKTKSEEETTPFFHVTQVDYTYSYTLQE